MFARKSKSLIMGKTWIFGCTLKSIISIHEKSSIHGSTSIYWKNVLVILLKKKLQDVNEQAK
jgi:hypothetical protein